MSFIPLIIHHFLPKCNSDIQLLSRIISIFVFGEIFRTQMFRQSEGRCPTTSYIFPLTRRIFNRGNQFNRVIFSHLERGKKKGFWGRSSYMCYCSGFMAVLAFLTIIKQITSQNYVINVS